jgi:hypothetical protein
MALSSTAQIQPLFAWCMRAVSLPTYGVRLLSESLRDVAFDTFCILRSLHILNGGFQFGAGFMPFTTNQPSTTLRLTAVKLTVNADVEEDVRKPGSIKRMLIGICHANSTIILEDCVFETTFGSPVMNQLVACMGGRGGQVGLHDLQANGLCATKLYDLFQHLRFVHIAYTSCSQFCTAELSYLHNGCHVLQVMVTNCTFRGFRRVVQVADSAQLTMKDCLVDLTMHQAYGGEGNIAPVVGAPSGDWSQDMSAAAADLMHAWQDLGIPPAMASSKCGACYHLPTLV